MGRVLLKKMVVTLFFAVLAASVPVGASEQNQLLGFQELNQKARTAIQSYDNAPFTVPENWEQSYVLLYCPKVFNKGSESVNLIVGFHGNLTTLTDGVFAPTMIAGFEEALGDTTDTCLILPQLMYNSKERNAGRLEERNGLQNLVTEVFHKNGITGKIGRVTIVAYSGGYWAASYSLMYNPGLDIRTVVYLDTLYWRAEFALDWVENGDKKVIVFSSEESRGFGINKYILDVATYFLPADKPPVEISEDAFFAGNIPDRFTVVDIDTGVIHEQVLSRLLGKVLKKLQGNG